MHPPARARTHWSPEQALAVFECLHALREALWAVYGPQVQQAWRDQLRAQSNLPRLASILTRRSDSRFPASAAIANDKGSEQEPLSFLSLIQLRQRI